MTNSRISNSLSYFLEQALILEKNSLETVSKVSDAVTSQKDTVTITLTDPNNSSNTITYSIPSFGYLKSEIERLDRTIKTLSNIESGAGSRVQLSDGTYRKIIASKLASEAPTITTTNNITNFNFKSNWLFEDMMNPYLYANVDLTNCVPIETERVLIQRFILNCSKQTQLRYFNTLKYKSTNLDYKSFLQGLLNNGISYVLDENYYNVPPLKNRYSGEFGIDRILDNTLTSDGKNIVIRVILNNLLYTDNNSGVENTVTLTKNDILEIKENPITTRYIITHVDASTNEVRLKRLEGYSAITNNTVFKISSNQVRKISIEIPVSFDKREVIFVKAIDPDSNIPSDKWSPGIVFYTNELKYTNPQGATTNLETFYQKNVIDFGNIILSYSKDYYPSIVEAITPDAPVLRYDAEDDSASDFRIVQINKQLEEGTEANTFRKLIAEKENALSQINNNNKLIEEQKEYIQTTKFSTTTEKQNAQNKLSEYIKNQTTYTSLYNSIVNQIKSQYAATYSEKPKYRVRGFWSIPSPKISKSSGPQQIIQFKIRYRYLSESGVANREEEFAYVDGTTKATGRFSNWNEVKTPLRRRIKGADGTYSWEKMNTADPDQININQLDLPIQNGEQIEIQIKSISEAGFPANPVESKWSEAVIISFSDFPELQGDDISEIIAQNRVDASVANVVDGLIGTTNAHMSSSFYTNDKYFAHTAENITSGFLSPEQTPITLYDKLYDLQNQITAINEQIKKTTGTIDVKLIDGEDNTKIYTLNENSTTYINAGNYVDDKISIDVNKRNGAIINKVYYINISSDIQNGLEILSKIPGDRLSMCPNTITETITQNPNGNDYSYYDNILSPSSISSDYYKCKGRYDLVPINLSASDIIDYQICSPNMYQSAQCKGQFIYSRFRNVSDTFDMYANEDISGISKFNPNADFLNSENIYNFKYNENDDNFWIERFNFYRPSGENGYISDITEITVNQKKNLYNYILNLYNNLTGSSLEYTIENYYMWKNTNSEKPNIVTDAFIIGNEPIFIGVYNKKGEKVEIDRSNSYYTYYGGYNTDTNKLTWFYGDDSSDEFMLDTENFTEGKYSVEIDNDAAVKNIKQIEVVLNRLPKTFKKSTVAVKSLFRDSKVTIRLNNLTSPIQTTTVTTNNNLIDKNAIEQNLLRANKITARSTVDVKTNSTASMNQIEPKIQAAYGFSDLGIIKNLIQSSTDNGSFVTTHKIGYEDVDRYRIGETSCDSYLFLSPLNHSDIQVDGDSNKAYKSVKPNESLRIPIIYQYRMEDYNGNIFGNSTYKSTDAIVKNTKFANIIGIDVWLDILSDTPKQYDIVVYSTYNNTNNRTLRSDLVKF